MPRMFDKKKKAVAIGQAALKVFLKKGYHQTKMADIADTAGIGKGTLYEYYKNKADILKFVFNGYFSAFKEGADQAVSSANTPGGKLTALIDFTLSHLVDWEDYCAVYIDYLGVVRTDVELRGVSDQIYGEASLLFSHLIKECQDSRELRGDVDPAAVAGLLLSFFDGVILSGIYSKPQCDADQLRETFLKLFQTGMEPQSRTALTKHRKERRN